MLTTLIEVAEAASARGHLDSSVAAREAIAGLRATLNGGAPNDAGEGN